MHGIIAQAGQLPDAATGAIWAAAISAFAGAITLGINAWKEDRKDDRSHQRSLRRIQLTDRCHEVASERDDWIIAAVARHPDLGPVPSFPDCEGPPDED